jgi:hypothetical protein
MNDKAKLKKPINVTIANVVSWYEESEHCLFHNHAQRIPITRIEDRDVVQYIIDDYCR